MRNMTGYVKFYTLPAEIIDMKIIRDKLIVECANGVTYIVPTTELENLRGKP